MRILSLLKNDLRRLFKDVGVMLSLLLIPLVFMVPTILNTDFETLDLDDDEKSEGTPLVIADYDGGEVALDYIKELDTNLKVEQNFSGDVLAEYELQDDPRCAQPSPACDEAVGRARLLDGSLSGVLVIPEGLTTAFKDGKHTNVALFFDPGGDALVATQIQKISQGLAIKVALTKQIDGAKGDFTDLSSVSDPKVQAEIDKILNQNTSIGTGKETAIHVDEVSPVGFTEKKKLGPVEQGIPQTSVLFIFMLPMFLTMWVREEQESGLLKRLLSTPAGKADMIIDKLLFGVLVCLVQMFIIVGLGILASTYKGHPVSIDIPGFLVLTLALSASSASIGLFISSTRLPSSTGLVPMLLGGLLGGALLFLDYLPAFMLPFSYIVPQRYGMVGYLDLVARGGTLVSILPEAGILCMFTLFFAGIAIWRLDLLD
ncbi:MAG: ABC transporter permease [Anaerolineae bacterium]|nr:ABC transporter permease [Anaerolineae bacterium]